MAIAILEIFVFIPLFVEHLPIINIRLIEEILVADTNPIQCRCFGKLALQLGVEVGVNLRLRALARKYGSREQPHIVKFIGILLRDVQRMESTHRQACDGAAVLIVDGAIVGFHILHHLGEGSLECAVHRLVQTGSGLNEALRRLARSGLKRCVAIGHHHYHRFCLAAGNQIVQNLCGAAQLRPCILVATHAMQKIEHRIALLSALVACRSVHRHAALQPQRRRIVPYLLNRPVCHIVNTIGVATLAGDYENVHHTLHVAKQKHIRRVVNFQSINHKIIIVKFRLERLGRGVFPHAILFGHLRSRWHLNLAKLGV